jgi:hypothetical protein
MTETLNLERKTKAAPDHDIEAAADDIIAILKEFESPKDAGSAFTLAHYKMIVASFPPGFMKEAFESVEGHAEMVESLLRDGWQ